MQKKVFDCTIFEIPIENFEADMNTESSKDKKERILDIFRNHNELNSEEEYQKIEYQLHYACQVGDLELIKILLSETIEDDSENYLIKIDKTNKTASFYGFNQQLNDIVIPRNVKYKNDDYLITSICFSCHILREPLIIKFVEDSAVSTIHGNAFLYSNIEEIYFPKSLIELKEGWCSGTRNLTRIIISPSNGQFIFKEDKYLIGKSNQNDTEFDKLLFVRRDIKEFSIPRNIKIIGSYSFSESKIEEISIPRSVTKICERAFSCCYKLRKIEIPTDSNLQTIERFAFLFSDIEDISIPRSVTKICECAFSNCRNLRKVEIPKNSNLQAIGKFAFLESNIEEIYIPYRVTKICESAFSCCINLRKVEIPKNSNLQTIEENAFLESNIEEIYIPRSVTKICESAFSCCRNLRKVEIPNNSNLQTIEGNAFLYSNIEEIYFPKSLIELKEFWCNDTRELKRIIISPSNGQFIFKEDKYLIGKSNQNDTEFDKLLFVRRDIKEIHLPRNIKIIGSYSFSESKIEEISIPRSVTKICERAFSCCNKLRKIEIPTDSNLQTIERCAFFFSDIEDISIPRSVTKICKDAFWYCYNLNVIEISEESQMQSISKSSFRGCQSSMLIMIPSSLKGLIERTD
ncbi:hypothetical protein M9Y10_031528 [Tritrichomonas musculus]|uniref:Uncharacterized protein n=1 Tax=Tritrichomonas musculus TaxID=1915356 RepID=A0ABR2H0V5_9EUKA